MSLSSCHTMAAKWMLLCFGIALLSSLRSAAAEVPTPTVWPTRFHGLLVQSYLGQLAVMDLWYDWGKGGNLHVIRNQLGTVTYDVEWNNGTSFFYDLEANTCTSISVGVGILRPDWLDNANYLGVQEVDGFTCNVWEKEDFFITYYEDVETKRPVRWMFYTGRLVDVISFDEGVYLQEENWQAPSVCFKEDQTLLSEAPLWHGMIKGPTLIDYKEWLLSGAVSA